MSPWQKRRPSPRPSRFPQLVLALEVSGETFALPAWTTRTCHMMSADVWLYLSFPFYFSVSVAKIRRYIVLPTTTVLE
jgi:hypothetical protein